MSEDYQHPLQISFLGFSALSSHQQLEMRHHLLFDVGLQITLRLYFLIRGCKWILICGSSQVPRYSCKDEQEIPDSAIILREAMFYNKAPYEFRADDEDIQWILKSHWLCP